MRGGDAEAQRHALQVPGSRSLAARDRTDEAPQRSGLDMCWSPESPALRADGVAASGHQQGSRELMLTVLILVAFAVMALVLILLAVVVLAIRQEPRDTEMSNVAPSLIAVLVRRLLGVYLRRPTPPADSAYWQEEWSPDMPPVAARSRPPSGRG
jgi:hypothetical protein